MGDVVKVTPFAFATPWSISWYPFWEGRPENPCELCCVSIRAGSICFMQSYVLKFSLCSNRLYSYEDCGQESKSMHSGQSHKRRVTTTSVKSCLCWLFTLHIDRPHVRLVLVCCHCCSLHFQSHTPAVSIVLFPECPFHSYIRLFNHHSPSKRFLWGRTASPLIPTNMCMSWKVNHVRSLQFWGLHVW